MFEPTTNSVLVNPSGYPICGMLPQVLFYLLITGTCLMKFKWGCVSEVTSWEVYISNRAGLVMLLTLRIRDALWTFLVNVQKRSNKQTQCRMRFLPLPHSSVSKILFQTFNCVVQSLHSCYFPCRLRSLLCWCSVCCVKLPTPFILLLSKLLNSS